MKFPLLSFPRYVLTVILEIADLNGIIHIKNQKR